MLLMLNEKILQDTRRNYCTKLFIHKIYRQRTHTIFGVDPIRLIMIFKEVMNEKQPAEEAAMTRPSRDGSGLKI